MFAVLFSQQNPDTTKILSVENGLLVSASVVFADSVVPRYNILQRMKFYRVPSVSIAIVKAGRIEWSKAYGYADVGEHRVADSHTVYQAASISKSVNALCILKLVQDGQLSLDKDIRYYLKTWNLPVNDPSSNRSITLRDLLSHSAGLSTSGFMGYARSDTLPTINEILDGRHPANSEPVRCVVEPGTTFKYSGGGTVVTRKIIEDNITRDYPGLVNTLVLKPLRMVESSFSQPLESERSNYATAYDASGTEIPGKYKVYPELSPDGLWTTATDLARFVVSIQQSLEGEPSLLNDSVAKEMVTPVLQNSNAGLGVFVDTRGGWRYFEHSGANVGYRSQFYASLFSGQAAVVLTNSDNGRPLIDEIINSISVAYNWGFYAPTVKRLVAVPDSILAMYVGEYISQEPSVTIKILASRHTLELTARRTEQLYPIGSNTFFIISSPNQDCVFLSVGGKGFDTFEVRENDKVLIRASRK